MFGAGWDTLTGANAGNQQYYYDEMGNLIEGIPEGTAYTGDYNPLTMGQSRFETLSEDPRLRMAQMEALQRMQGIAAGGITPEDRAAMQIANANVAQQNRSAQDAIQQNLRARGGAVSPAQEMMMRQAANQQAGQARALGGMDMANQARNRALQALSAGSQMAGTVRGQDYGVASDRARAADTISQFNTQTQNQGQLRNLDTRQNLALANTAQATARAKARADVAGAKGSYYGQRDAQGRQDLGNMINAGTSFIPGGSMFNQLFKKA
jgi:hypothetical protein